MKHLLRPNPLHRMALVVAVSLLSSVSSSMGEEFTSVNREVTVSDLGNWKVTANEVTKRQNGVLTQFSSNKDSDNSIRIETYDVNYFDVFDAKIVDAFRQGIKKDGTNIITVKPIELARRRYQGIFAVRLDKSGDEPLLVYVEQLVLVDKNRFHNITIASDRDEPETNPEILFFLEHLSIK